MFDFKNIVKPKSIEEAICCLKKPNTVVVSGGTDVLIKLRDCMFTDCSLISINEINELKGIHISDNKTITIKAATSFTHVINSSIIQKHIPVLAQAVEQIGGPQIRNIGTIGGNISNGMSGADSATTLLVLDAKLKLESEGANVRMIPLKEYYVSPGKVCLRPTEILTEIIIEKENYEKYFGHYTKYAAREAMDLAILGCSVILKISVDKTIIEDIKIALGVVGPVPFRCFEVEKIGKNLPVSKESLQQISESLQTNVKPIPSWKASKEFHSHLIKEVSKRTIAQAIINAGGNMND